MWTQVRPLQQVDVVVHWGTETSPLLEENGGLSASRGGLTRTLIFHRLWHAFVACWLWAERQGDDGWKPQPGIKGFLAGAQGPAESYRDTSTPSLSKSLTQVRACEHEHQGTPWRERAQRAAVKACVCRNRRGEWQSGSPKRDGGTFTHRFWCTR